MVESPLENDPVKKYTDIINKLNTDDLINLNKHIDSVVKTSPEILQKYPTIFTGNDIKLEYSERDEPQSSITNFLLNQRNVMPYNNHLKTTWQEEFKKDIPGISSNEPNCYLCNDIYFGSCKLCSETICVLCSMSYYDKEHFGFCFICKKCYQSK